MLFGMLAIDGAIVAKSVTVAKFVYSGFDSEENMFRRQVVGADGYGYDLLRPKSVDRQNLQIESAVVSDVRLWLRESSHREHSVIPFAPRVSSACEIKWRPQIRVARATRSYWRADCQHIFTRVISTDGDTYNFYTPARLIAQALNVFDTTEAEARAQVHGDDGLDWESNNHIQK